MPLSQEALIIAPFYNGGQLFLGCLVLLHQRFIRHGKIKGLISCVFLSCLDGTVMILPHIQGQHSVERISENETYILDAHHFKFDVTSK